MVKRIGAILFVSGFHGGKDAVDMDEWLGRELYRLSVYADLVAIVPGQDALRFPRIHRIRKDKTAGTSIPSRPAAA
jgi:hypothetical protein